MKGFRCPLWKLQGKVAAILSKCKTAILACGETSLIGIYNKVSVYRAL